jgi:ribose transport system ATP-binding protein
MDEPTAALSDRETDRLFEVVRQLRSEGMAIIYISHRMAEVYELADRLSVLRDGEYVGELLRPEFSADKVIEMMVGRRLEDFYEHTKHTAGRVVMDVKNMSDGDRVKNASFQLRQGEVLGLAGLVGAGRTELARLIFGADKRKSGEVYLDGKKLQINQPRDAIRAGIGYVPNVRVSSVLAGETNPKAALDDIYQTWEQITEHYGRENQKKLYAESYAA